MHELRSQIVVDKGTAPGSPFIEPAVQLWKAALPKVMPLLGQPHLVTEGWKGCGISPVTSTRYGTALLSEACSRSPYGLAKALSGMHLRWFLPPPSSSQVLVSNKHLSPEPHFSVCFLKTLPVAAVTGSGPRKQAVRLGSGPALLSLSAGKEDPIAGGRWSTHRPQHKVASNC